MSFWIFRFDPPGPADTTAKKQRNKGRRKEKTAAMPGETVGAISSLRLPLFLCSFAVAFGAMLEHSRHNP
jgi:hypothetical protein